MRRGPLYMIFASLLFTVMVALVKLAREELSAVDVMVWRALTSVPLVWLLARRVGLRVKAPRLMALRVVLGFGAMFSYFTAAKGLSLADISLFARLQPILITALAPWALGSTERAGGRLWLLLVAGLAGAAVMLAPELAIGSTWGLWAVASAVLAAGAHLCVRGLGSTDHPFRVVFWFQLWMAFIALPIAVIDHGGLVLPPVHLWPVLLGCGLTASAAQVLLTQAYRIDRAAPVAAASYAAPVWAVIGDLVVFGVLPGGHAMIGGGLIVAVGLLLVFQRAAPAEDPVARVP